MGPFPSSTLYGDEKKPGTCKDAMSWGKYDQRAISPGRPAQPVLEYSSERELTGQSMPRVPAPRALACSMNPVTPTLVSKPKFVHQPGCQGTHEARHLLLHRPFYSSTGKGPLGASHTVGNTGRAGYKAGPGDILRDWCVNQIKLSSFTQIESSDSLPPTLCQVPKTHRSNSQKGKGDPHSLWH